MGMRESLLYLMNDNGIAVYSFSWSMYHVFSILLPHTTEKYSHSAAEQHPVDANVSSRQYHFLPFPLQTTASHPNSPAQHYY